MIAFCNHEYVCFALEVAELSVGRIMSEGDSACSACGRTTGEAGPIAAVVDTYIQGDLHDTERVCADCAQAAEGSGGANFERRVTWL